MSKQRELAKSFGLPDGWIAKWVNGSKPTGRYKGFQRGGLPRLCVQSPDEKYDIPIGFLAGEVHYGTNKHIEGTPITLYVMRRGGNGRIKKQAKTVDEGKNLLEIFFGREGGQKLLKDWLYREETPK